MKKIRCLVAVCVLLLLTGCGAILLFGAGTAAGVAGYKYINGTMEVLYDFPFINTWDATLKALSDLGITVKDSKHDLTGGKIEGSRADGQTIKVSLTYKSPKETEVSIRVGIIGDEGGSAAIRDKIASVLMENK